MEFAGFCKDVVTKEKEIITGEDKDGNDIKELKKVPDLDEDGNKRYIYSLRYEEFIALNTAMIQYQQKEIDDLKQRMDKMKEQIDFLIQKK